MEPIDRGEWQGWGHGLWAWLALELLSTRVPPKGEKPAIVVPVDNRGIRVPIGGPVSECGHKKSGLPSKENRL